MAYPYWMTGRISNNSLFLKWKTAIILTCKKQLRNSNLMAHECRTQVCAWPISLGHSPLLPSLPEQKKHKLEHSTAHSHLPNIPDFRCQVGWSIAQIAWCENTVRHLIRKRKEWTGSKSQSQVWCISRVGCCEHQTPGCYNNPLWGVQQNW